MQIFYSYLGMKNINYNCWVQGIIHDYIWVTERYWSIVYWRKKGPENHLWLIMFSVSQILPDRDSNNYWKNTLIWMYLINFFSIVSSWSFPTGSSDKRNRHVRGNVQLYAFCFDLQWPGDAILLKHSHKHVLNIYYSISAEKVVFG